MFMVYMITLVLLLGCSGQIKPEQPTFKATGVVDSVEKKDNAVIDGVKVLYVIHLSSLESGSLTNEEDPYIVITKNSAIYLTTDDKKSKADISAVKKEQRAEITWTFANDYLSEALIVELK